MSNKPVNYNDLDNRFLKCLITVCAIVVVAFMVVLMAFLCLPVVFLASVASIIGIVAALDGFITDFTITAANIDDREALWELVSKYNSLTIIGDKGYLNKDFATDLKLEKNIDLIPIKRNNSKDQYSKLFRQLIFKLRRMIETVGSQLSCQLNIQNVLTKSLLGFMARIKTKLLAHNLCCFVNKALGRDISRIKELIFG